MKFKSMATGMIKYGLPLASIASNKAGHIPSTKQTTEQYRYISSIECISAENAENQHFHFFILYSIYS